MKKILLITAILPMLHQLHAQVKYAWLEGKKTYFNTPSNKIAITFKPGTTRQRMKDIATTAYQKKKINEIPIVGGRSVIYTVASGEDTQQWNLRPEVKTVTPFYKVNDRTEVSPGDEFFVKLKSITDLTMLKQKIQDQGLEIIKENKYIPNLFLLRCPAGIDAMEVANTWAETNLFAYCEPNFRIIMKVPQPNVGQSMPLSSNLVARTTTNDALQGNQWAIENSGSYKDKNDTLHNITPGCDMRVKRAWDATTGNSNVKIAIIDDGVDLTHPDLINNLVPGHDATDGNNGCGINGGFCNGAVDMHGTACAGIAAASGNNSIGITGVAFGAKIMPIRVAYGISGDDFYTETDFQENAINWAWANGASVLSNSWGGGLPSSAVSDAITAATNFGRGGLGAIVLFAAGNKNSAVSYPALFYKSIAVGAMSPCDTRKTPTLCDGENWGSNFGTHLDVSAPGVWIEATDIAGAGGYTGSDYIHDFGGTSAACPNVAGVVALMFSVARPYTSGAYIRNVLEQSCRKVGTYTYNSNIPNQPNGTWSTDLGYGMVDAYNAVLRTMDNGCSADWNITQNISTSQQYEATNTVTGQSQLSGNGLVIFDAGARVTMKPGFKALLGIRFIGRIQGCGGTPP